MKIRIIIIIIIIILSLFASTGNTLYSFNFIISSTSTSSYIFLDNQLNDKLFYNTFGKRKFDYPFYDDKKNRQITNEKGNSNDDNDNKKIFEIKFNASISDSIYYDNNNDVVNSFKARNTILFTIGDNFRVFNDMLLDQSLYENPNYSGNKWRNLAGYTRSAFCEFNLDEYSFTARFGRYPVNQGVSNFDNFLFSETAEGFTKLHFLFDFEKLSFETFSGKLNNMDRNIAMHRIRFDFNQYFKFNITEAVVYTGVTNIEYVNPFTFYHGVQLNGGGEANTVGSFEFESYLSDNFRFYTAFLLDDIQLDNQVVGDLEPDEIGWLGGFSLKNIFTGNKDLLEYEYSGITKRTYNTPHDGQKFMLGSTGSESELLGNKLGNDFDIHRLRYILFFSKNSTYKLNLNYLRKGEGSVQDEFDTPWIEGYTVEEGYSEPFPTGDIKYIFSSEIGFDYLFGKYGKISSYLIYSKVMNGGDATFKGGVMLSIEFEYLNLEP